MSRFRGPRPAVLVLLVIALQTIVYYGWSSTMLPNEAGRLGHDYSYFLPALLDGKFFFLENDWWSVPWFTPGFCGGIPAFANPQNAYFSVPQLLFFVASPIATLRLTVILFFLAGLTGAYRYLSTSLKLDWRWSLVGATLFAWNGFFIHRMWIGHLAFHSFMLLPWIIYGLSSDEGATRPHRVRRLLLAAVGLAYVIVSGGANLLIILVPAMVISLTLQPGLRLRTSLARLTLVGCVAIILSLAKVSAILHLMAGLPRAHITPPGFQTIGDVALFPLAQLFWRGGSAGADAAREASMLSTYAMQAHEFEYGVGPLALLLLILALVFYLRNRRRLSYRPEFKHLVAVCTIFVCLLVGFHHPVLHSWIKTIPVLRSSSVLFRMYAGLIFPISCMCCFAFFRATRRYSEAASGWRVRLLGGGALLCMFLVPLWHILGETEFYQSQPYSPELVSNRSLLTGTDGAPPTRVEYLYQPRRSTQPNLVMNDAVAVGGSKLRCYEPMFGYRLEELKHHGLQPGPIEAKIGEDEFNMLNPACVVFPQENSCEPGDHFASAQLTELRRFASRRPWKFRVSGTQRLAGIVNVAALLALVGWLLWAGICRFRRAYSSRGRLRTEGVDGEG